MNRNAWKKRTTLEKMSQLRHPPGFDWMGGFGSNSIFLRLIHYVENKRLSNIHFATIFNQNRWNGWLVDFP